MGKTFDQEYFDVIESMKKHLEKDNFRAISFTFSDGYEFHLSISKKNWKKLQESRAKQ